MLSIPKAAWALAAGVLLVALISWQWPGTRPEAEPLDPPQGDDESPTPLANHLAPLIRASNPHLNTTNAANYVGNDACISCHEDQHQSYRKTGHSRALGKPRPEIEPPDGEFYHATSRKWYKVYRDGEELRHREYVKDDEGRELVLSDHAVAWTIGSGRFSKSYLVEEDGFLIESPITWYASQEQWGMSPGYDRPEHPGFERLAGFGCLVCHAGQVRTTKGNGFRPRIVQSAIGCENCHGPGPLHVAEQQSGKAGGNAELTIVNPAKLERRLSEAICANCHLRGEATVVRRGLSLTDFRPGLPLSDIRIDYGREQPTEDMEVVGHMEQMWLSRCYTESNTLTCITCHDPHHQPQPTEEVAAYRRVCLDCHGVQGCGLPMPERLDKSPADDCISCHMPKTDTDIPHFAFTHHRIAKPEAKRNRPKPRDSKPAVLKPLADVSHLPESERNRNLGLAYLEFAQKEPEHYKFHLYHAGHLLERGDPDSDCLAGLARIYWETDLSTASATAEEALRSKTLSHSARANALVVRGMEHLRGGRFRLAEQDFEELTSLKRSAGYWHLLAGARLRQNQLPEAVDALEQAIHIAPGRIDFRKMMIDLLLRSGQSEQANRHQHAIDVLTASREAGS